MLTDTEIEQLRADQRAWMTSSCTITRGSSEEMTYDDETGTWEPVDGAPVYEGACRLMPPGGGRAETQVEHGEADLTVRPYVLTIPHDAPEVRVNDVAVIDDDAFPVLSGRALRVLSVTYSTIDTARRLEVQDIESSEAVTGS